MTLRLCLIVVAAFLALVPALLSFAVDPPATQPTTTTAPVESDAAKALKAHVDRICLELDYRGGQDKPFYTMALCVDKADLKAPGSFHQTGQITPELARKLIDHLTEVGFFDRARDVRAGEDAVPMGYCLTVHDAGKADGPLWRENLFMNLGTFKRLDALYGVLDDDAKAVMEPVLSRLGGIRHQLEPAATQPAK